MAEDGEEDYIENRTFEELTIGESASLSHVVAQRDIDLFAAVSGDVNPAHVDPVYAATDIFHGVVIHGMWSAGLISAVIGTKLPGPGTIYLGQELRFRHPVLIGDAITATVTVREKKPEHGDVTLDCVCTNQKGQQVVTGAAYARAPKAKVRRLRMAQPYVRVGRHDHLQALMAQANGGAALPAAIVYPIDSASLNAALDGARAGYILPILIGPEAQIKAAAALTGADIGALRLIDAPDAATAARKAVSLVRAGEAECVMKGDLHTEDLLRAIVDAETGLRTPRRISHVYFMDIPDYPKPLLITDTAVNITPNLAEKTAIVQNAIDLAVLLGIAKPRVAILSAIETINPHLASTLDAAALCKMAERGQISGGVLDGPLALDNAINAAAAAEKGIVSAVAGQADILVVPDLEAGNMLAKQLIFLAGAQGAGVVLGARAPIILTSRADSALTRLASCALAVLVARGRMTG